MTKHFIPVLTQLFSAMLSMALIHFWLASFISSFGGISYKATYGYLTSLLILWTCARILSVLNGNDKITTMVDKWLKNKD